MPSDNSSESVKPGQHQGVRQSESSPERLFRRQWQGRPSKLDPFIDHLDRQWDNGLSVGLDRDLAAVIAGFTLPWSSGVVEGRMNRIKMLKRQMFGCAGFDLLRKRVLLAD
ncbi:hypothetical protein [Yinghuangia seranimata]|uniref:hypothetical protein n=1 Tax=Yinghuangia seranimata TaxID=408067 RepID=UPI003CCF1C72